MSGACADTKQHAGSRVTSPEVVHTTARANPPTYSALHSPCACTQHRARSRTGSTTSRTQCGPHAKATPQRETNTRSKGTSAAQGTGFRGAMHIHSLSECHRLQSVFSAELVAKKKKNNNNNKEEELELRWKKKKGEEEEEEEE